MNSFRTALLTVLLPLLLTLPERVSAHYDPGTQRWLSRDPLAEEGGLNLYEFVANSPPASLDPFGLVLKIDPSSDAEFQKRMLGCIRALVNQSPYGLNLVQEAIDSPSTITITPDDDGAGCDGYAGAPSWSTPNPIITMHPTSPNGASPEQNCGARKCNEGSPNNVQGCAIILAHELGHALYNYSEPQAVVYSENPVRRGFGQPLRTTYRCKPVYPPDRLSR